MPFDMHEIVGTHDIAFFTVDTLRYDVAQQAFHRGETPNIARYLDVAGWECRHTPANFTYAAHHAFFAGFLPTLIDRPKAPRLFACDFEGSETTSEHTAVFQESTFVEGLASAGYETHCIGGVGFFNKKNSLGRVLPGFFQQSYWKEEFSVAHPRSTENQVQLATHLIQSKSMSRMFLFMNLSACHQPNCIYTEGAEADSPQTQAAALRYVDRSLAALFEMLELTSPWFVIICSDHGTAYGEQGKVGHRWNHPVIGDVPYAEFVVGK